MRQSTRLTLITSALGLVSAGIAFATVKVVDHVRPEYRSRTLDVTAPATSLSRSFNSAEVLEVDIATAEKGTRTESAAAQTIRIVEPESRTLVPSGHAVASNEILPSPARARRSAPARIVEGYYIGKDWVHGGSEVNCVMQVVADQSDPTMIHIHNFYGLEETVDAVVDVTTGSLSILPQRIWKNTTYGDVYMFPISYVGDKVQFYPTTPVLGSIDSEGVIRLPQWGAIVGYGDNAGMMLAAIDSGEYIPSNATMTATKRTDDQDSQITYPLLVEQASPAEMTIYNFGTTGVPVRARVGSDRKVTVSPQFIASMGLYGDFHCFPINPQTNAIDKTSPIGGTMTGNTVTFDPWVAGSIMQDGLVALWLPASSLSATITLQAPQPVPASFEGQGTASSPWLIKTAADLQALSEASQKNSFAGKYFRQTADIDMSGVKGFVPVGSQKAAFNGNYDGDNHVISNLTIDAVGYHFQGLFGALYTESKISNVILRKASLRGTGYYLGLLAGYSQGVIDNCRVQGDINTTGMCVGGVIGRSYGAVRRSGFSGTVSACGYVGGVAGYSYGEISSCFSDANVRLPVRLTDGASCAGGIAGLAQSFSTALEGKIHDCRFSGTVTQGSGYGFTGGIAGYVYAADMQRCLNTGSVTTTSTGGTEEPTGGICGIIRDSSMTDCLNAGQVSHAGSSTYTGGLIGFITTSYNSIDGMTEPVKVRNCLNTGQVVASSRTAHAGVFGDEYTLDMFDEKPSDTAFTHVYTDNQATGLRDTVYGRDTRVLTSGLPEGFGTAWTSNTGMYPTLKSFADTDEGILSAAAVLFADGESTRVMKHTATLATPAGVRWYVLSRGEMTDISEGLMREGSSLSLRGVYANDTVVASVSGSRSGRRYAINVVPKVFQGEGTQADPYLIASKADFMKLDNAVMHYDHEGDFFLQTADVDFGMADDFQGVAAGNHLREFAGVFDGGNHAVKGLKIRAVRTNDAGQALQGTYNYGGLFHIGTPTSVVRNVVIDSSCDLEFYGYGGAVIGYTKGTVENCRNYAAVKRGSQRTGGIVGHLDEGGRIAGCYNSGDIASSGHYTGGIVGQNMGIVYGSQNDADITSAGNYTGGVAGASAGTLELAFNSGTVTGAEYIGGVVGSNSAGYGLGDIVSCLSSGLVVSDADSKGGVAGYSNGRGRVSDNWYDGSVNNMDGCSSLSQGFTALSTAELIDGSDAMKSDKVQYFPSAYPSLKEFAAEPAGLARRGIFVRFGKGEKRTNVLRATDLATDARIAWQLKVKQNFTLADGKLNVTLPEQDVVADTLTAVFNGQYTKVFPLKSIPVILAGSGSEGAPFQIKSHEDLALLASFMERSGMDYEGYHFQVMNDIVYPDTVAFAPIARTGVQFQGDFDGNGKTVSGIAFTDEASKTGKNIGFFGTVGSKGTVRNLTLAGNLKAYSYSGAFAGLLYGTIRNCESKMNVDGKGGYSAGFVGRMYDGARIEKSVFSGAVSPNYQTNYNYIGGFAGQVDDGAVIDSCVNRGTVGNFKNTTGTTYTGQQYVGGIAAMNLGIISNSRNEGRVQGRMHLGGIAGRAGKTGRFYDCVNAADIEALGGGYVAGIAPQTAGSGHSEIRRCSNSGNLRGKGYVAGIIGAITNGMSVDSCYNTGRIAGFSSVAYGVGGVIGQMQSNTSWPSSVSNSCNAGEVYNEAQSTGGFAGKITAGTVTDCHNTGNVTVAKEKDDLSANGVGGFIGSFSATAERIWNSGDVVSNVPSAAGIFGTGAMPIAQVKSAVNFGNVTLSRVIPDKGYGAGGIWGGYGPAEIHECYNYGTVTAPDCAGGISGGMWSNGNGGSVISRCYNAGKVVVPDTALHASNIAIISIAKDVDASLMRVDSAYFDKDIALVIKGDTLGTGLTRKEMMTAALGDAFIYRPACLPTLAYMDEVPLAAFHAAHIDFAEGDSEDSVSKAFRVGMMPHVVWTSSTNLGIDEEGNVTSHSAGEGWVRAETDEPSLGLEKTFSVKTLYSGIGSTLTDGRVVERVEYYTLKGIRTIRPEAGEIYIVKTIYTDGSCSVAKALAR